MSELFDTIADFIAIKDNCIFCAHKLMPVFTSFAGSINASNNYLPPISANLIDNHFTFKLQYYSVSDSIDAVINVDITNNQASFSTPIIGTSIIEHEFLDTQPTAINVLENLKPHVELRCPNSQCRMGYYLCSDSFRLESYWRSKNVIPEIKPFYLYMECFNLNQYWIQNNWINNQTNIYSPKQSVEPLRFPMIDFSSMEPEKLLTRLHTLITFT